MPYNPFMLPQFGGGSRSGGKPQFQGGPSGMQRRRGDPGYQGLQPMPQFQGGPAMQPGTQFHGGPGGLPFDMGRGGIPVPPESGGALPAIGTGLTGQPHPLLLQLMAALNGRGMPVGVGGLGGGGGFLR